MDNMTFMDFLVYGFNRTELYVYIFVLGLIIGSFMNVVIHRVPIIIKRRRLRKAGVYTPRYTLSYPSSSCPACNHRIRWYENIPLLSYLILKGECSSCDAPISIRYPLIELGTGFAFLMLFKAFVL